MALILFLTWFPLLSKKFAQFADNKINKNIRELKNLKKAPNTHIVSKHFDTVNPDADTLLVINFSLEVSLSVDMKNGYF